MDEPDSRLGTLILHPVASSIFFKVSPPVPINAPNDFGATVISADDLLDVASVDTGCDANAFFSSSFFCLRSLFFSDFLAPGVSHSPSSYTTCERTQQIGEQHCRNITITAHDLTSITYPQTTQGSISCFLQLTNAAFSSFVGFVAFTGAFSSSTPFFFFLFLPPAAACSRAALALAAAAAAAAAIAAAFSSASFFKAYIQYMYMYMSMNTCVTTYIHVEIQAHDIPSCISSI